MRPQLTPKAPARRVVTVLRRAAVLVAALAVAVPAAATVERSAAGTRESAGSAKAFGVDVTPVSATGVASQRERRLWSATLSDCRAYEICIWSGDNFTGAGIFYSGNYDPCEGWRLEGTVWQDHTWSIWNRASGPITVWNRYSDGSYRYHKIAYLPSGYRHGARFSNIMDAWVYDPGNNCTSLYMWPSHNPY
jgi:hypothetical protein